MPISIATWNINSVRIRTGLIARLLEEAAPEVLCLQETKVTDDQFPEAELVALGYPHIAFSGQKSYNGVAILSKVPLADIAVMDLLGNGEKRHIAATLPDGTRLHNFYVPAGGDVPDPEENPKFRDKLAFVAAMTDWAKTVRADEKTVIVGDFNIAPGEQDVWSHKQLLKIVSHTPVEVEALTRLQEVTGWVDTARAFTPWHEKLYSWWSYRNRDWKKSDRGRRLDHIWVTPGLCSALKQCHTLRHVRDWESPSDHVPVVATLEM